MKNYQRPYRPEIHISQATITRLIGVALILFVVIIALSQATFVVRPGFRGVKITLGKVEQQFAREGLGFKSPFITKVMPITIRQQTSELKAECYSSDLQQVNTQLQVLYRIPEQSVVRIFQDYAGQPFDSLIAPRVQEAMKEVAAMQPAEMIVTNRFEVKSRALALARAKIGADFIHIVDLVLEDISLSKELELAIEQKMIQEQEAAKAKFTQRQAEIDAQTSIIRAKGEADSIRIRGEALDVNPVFVDWQIVQKWNGKSPLVIGGNDGGNILVPLPDIQSNQ